MHSHGPNSAFESETFGEDLSFRIEQPVGSMSISPCARDVVLASKEGLHIIDLDSPYSPPRYLPHRTSWEVADVQWSPFTARDFWVVSTSNQKALVWNLGIRSHEDSVEFVLHGHTRAITDINFSAHHPDVLATCAVDSFVHCWDLRIPTRPVVSFSDWFAGATQVKWNRQVSHVIASSHNKYLRVWDDRMGAYPVRSIEAHDAKIYGIDWNRHEQDRIVTCSLDKSIKFWDCNNLEDVPERTINTSFPAWRARHTPFGSGLLAMPQRGNGDLHLYDRRPINGQHSNGAVPPVVRFEGHKGQVKEFLWRPRGTVIDGVDHREFQLVTWGTDQELRLHRMIPETLLAIGYERGATQTVRLNFTRQGATYKTFRDEPSVEDFDEVFGSQTGSSPTAGHSFHSRPRGSTSVGMSKVAIPHAQGWLQGSIGTSRIGMHGRNNVRQIMNPIDWMKNVKISSWNSEMLGEEIAQVGEKFTKVVFEKVDVPQRKAVISMHAPWGDSISSIFMKIDIKFPTAYPSEAAAIFNIQKTAAMTDKLAETLSTELRTIAETYVARRRGCLEAVLRYLLREQDMEQIVSWILEESMDNIKIVDDIGFPEDISSDEEDVGLTTFQGPPGMIDSSSVINANARMPVPRTCGAQWADNGKLVCFFIPQSKQPTSFLDLLGTRANDSDRSDNVFEGFGRLQTESPGARTTLRTVTSGEDQTSEFSDDSSFTSSSSSGSSDSLNFLPSRLLPKNAFQVSRAALQRSRSADHSAQSALGFSKDKLGTDSSANVVSIHDLIELVPSKRELAVEYVVFGKGQDMCSHNADVALKYGFKDIFHIWSLIKLILRDEVPLEIISNLKGTSDILVIARCASGVVIGNDSGVDLSYDGPPRRSRVNSSGRVRWGESGFGGTFLVPALIHHFESLGDVQMLAMLSCVFAEPRNSNSLAILSQQHRHQPSMQLNASTSHVDYHPSVEVARSVTDRASTTSLAPGTTTARISEVSHMTLTDRGSSSNPTTPNFTGTTPPHPVLHLPTDRRRSSRLSGVDVRENNHRYSASTPHSGPVSLSTSAEDPRSAHRFNPNVAFPLSRASLSAFAPSFSQSPPNVSNGGAGHKRSSPVGSFMANHVNPGGWTASSIFGGSGLGRGKVEASAQMARPRGGSAHPGSSTTFAHSQSLSSDGDTIDRVRGGRSSASAPKSRSSMQTHLQSKTRNGAKRRVKVRSSLHNQTMFDGDGYANVPLLDPSLEWKYRAYRASYAHLLAVWDLHTHRAEILKFDDLLGSSKSKPKEVIADRHTDDDELALGNTLRQKTIDVTRTSSVPNRGLEILRLCNQCGGMLEAIEKNGRPIGWHCVACRLAQSKSSTKTMCAICTKSIAGLMVPCMNCNHVTCFECQQKWLIRDNSVNEIDDAALVDPLEAAEKSCPTGCGCVCSTYQFVTAPDPPPSEDEGDDHGNDITSQSPVETLAALEAVDFISTHAPRTAMDAFLSLSRARSISSSKAASSDTGKTRSQLETPIVHQQGKEESAGEVPQTDAWAKYANMGKGLGAGLTRTAMLRERGSSTTIRRDSEAEVRLRMAGGMYD